MNDQDLKQLEAEHIMQTYRRLDVVLTKGEGCYVYDSMGKKYLDCLGGIATCTVGHGNPAFTKAVSEQTERLISVSNLFYSEPQILLAEKLSELSGLQKAFFCHAGADANEAAIKLAKKVTGKTDFIAFKNGFHGRTTGSLALTWKPQYREPFMPLTPLVSFAEYNDVDSVRALITDTTAAVFVEPIQGEAGIVVPDPEFLKDLRKLCDEQHILLIADEVQTGVGRTGKFFAYQHADILPDIVTLAKGLANGLPIGACLSNYELTAGEHGSTLGGNNVCAAAALATLEYMATHDVVANAAKVGAYLLNGLQKLESPLIVEARGQGLMLAVELSKDVAADLVNEALEQGLIINAATPSTLRLLPPLTLTIEQADECLEKLQKVLA